MKYAEYMTAMQQDDASISPNALIAVYEQGIEDLRSAVAGMSQKQLLTRPIAEKRAAL